MAQPISVLLLDPDDEACAESVAAFTSRGWSVHHASTFLEALELVPKHFYNLVMIEVMLPDMVGTDAWTYFRRLSPNTAGIIMTASRSLRHSINAAEHGIISFLLKPFDTDIVCDLIVQTAANQRMVSENKRVEAQLARLGACLSGISHASSDQVINTALAHIPTVWKADWVVVYRLNPNKSWTPQWINQNHVSLKRGWTPTRYDFIEHLLAQSIESAKPLVLGVPEPGVPLPNSKELDLGSLVIVPLLGRDLAYGALTVINRLNSEHPLTALEVELIKVVGESIAMALDSSHSARQNASHASQDDAAATDNADYLDQAIALEAARGKRYNHSFSFVVSNLPDGNQPGREAEVDAVQLLRQQLRGSDVIARLSEREIGILLPETKSEAAQFVAQRIQRILEDTPQAPKLRRAWT